MFSQQVSCGEHVYYPECNSMNVLVLKGDGFQIGGLDFIGIICNDCKKVYYFYDVNFRKLVLTCVLISDNMYLAITSENTE